MHKRLAKIQKTFLGIEDHGILTGWLDVDYGSTMQGVGFYTLDTYDPEKKKRIGHSAASDWLLNVLKVAGVDSWEKLPGRHIYVLKENDDWHSKIIGIAQIETEGSNEFIFEDVFHD